MDLHGLDAGPQRRRPGRRRSSARQRRQPEDVQPKNFTVLVATISEAANDGTKDITSDPMEPRRRHFLMVPVFRTSSMLASGWTACMCSTAPGTGTVHRRMWKNQDVRPSATSIEENHANLPNRGEIPPCDGGSTNFYSFEVSSRDLECVASRKTLKFETGVA